MHEHAPRLCCVEPFAILSVNKVKQYTQQKIFFDQRFSTNFEIKFSDKPLILKAFGSLPDS